MAKIPESVLDKPIPGLNLLSRGKVRDIYGLGNGFLLMVATDRISIFDFLLAALIPQKGEGLTALNIFWASQLQQECSVAQDIIAFGVNIDSYLPRNLRGNPWLQKRAIVVIKTLPIPIEAVVRGYLTGSGWSAYQGTAPNHMVCGHRLPGGLKDSSRLPEAIFTPTTKAIEGHDVHMSVEEARKRFDGRIETLAIHLFETASEIAFERDIIIADTKFEFGTLDGSNALVLIDERFTPDSSRFWSADDLEAARKEGRTPPSLDKQFVREWGKTVGIDKRDPENPRDVEYVHGLTVPPEVIKKTAELYTGGGVIRPLTGMRLDQFQRSVMGVNA